MNDIDSQISNLKSAIQKAQTARIRAEAAKEIAEANYAVLTSRLREEFGVDTPHQARAKLDQLQTTLQSKMAEASRIADNI